MSAVRDALKALYRKGDIVELRAWDKGEGLAQVKMVGRYRYGHCLLAVIEAMDADDLGLDQYFVLNPVMLSEKLWMSPLSEHGLGAWEKDIPVRRWFLLDVDTQHGKHPASDEQWEGAHRVAKDARAWLQGYGMEGMVLASSGNGVHLLVPCNLPNDPPSKNLVMRAQRAIAERFNTPDIEVECFADSNRLVRAYGTLNRKGLETEALRYRRSGILDVSHGVCNERKVLERIVLDNPVALPERAHDAGEGVGPFTREILEERLEAWMDSYEGACGEEFQYEQGDRKDGYRVWCPGNFPDGWPDGEQHGDMYRHLNDSTMVWVENGWPKFSCRHFHCSEGATHGKKTWKDLQEFYDPARRLHTVIETGWLDEADIARGWGWELGKEGV